MPEILATAQIRIISVEEKRQDRNRSERLFWPKVDLLPVAFVHPEAGTFVSVHRKLTRRGKLAP